MKPSGPSYSSWPERDDPPRPRSHARGALAPGPIVRRQPVDELAEILGDRTLRALQEGRAVLRIWRRTVPQNWWVEGPRGRVYWHSAEGYPRPSLRRFTAGRPSYRGDLTTHRLKKNERP
jgi:hypothetical protein